MSSDNIRRYVDNLLVSLFYIELVRHPEFNHIVWVYKEVIRYYLRPLYRGLQELIGCLKED